MPAKLRLTAACVLGLAAATLSGCTPKVEAPKEYNVCYFIGHPADGSLKFNVISKSEPDIEHCAVRLYNMRTMMMRTGTAGAETDGAYNGNFLFADSHEIRQAQSYDGPSFPFLIHTADGRLVVPGSIETDDAGTNTPSGPTTVDVPKNLPNIDAPITQDPKDEPRLAPHDPIAPPAAKKP